MDGWLEDCLCVVVSLLPKDDRSLFQASCQETVGPFKELLRRHWQLKAGDELVLLVDRREGPHEVEDATTFKEILEDDDIMKRAGKRARKSHLLRLSLHCFTPVTLTCDWRPQQPVHRERAWPVWQRPDDGEPVRCAQRMCPRCGTGPVVNFECSNMRSRNHGRGIFSQGTNACPTCNHFSPQWEDWAEWDETRANELRERYRAGWRRFLQ